MKTEEIFKNFNKTSRLLWNVQYVESELSEKQESWHEDFYHYKEYNFFGNDKADFIAIPMLDELGESDFHAIDIVGEIRGTLYIDKEKQKCGLMTDI
jgi:hypothetical protein